MASNDQILTARIQSLEAQLREANSAKRDLEDRLASESTVLWQELAEANSARHEVESRLSSEVQSLLHKLEETNSAKRALEERLVAEGDVLLNELSEIKEAKDELEQRLLRELAEANSGRDTIFRELVEAKEVCGELEFKLQQAESEKTSLREELTRASKELERISTLEQTLEEASQKIVTHQDKTDGQEVLICTLEEKLRESEDSQAVLQQELSIAKANNEHTSLIERDLKKAVEQTQKMATELELLVLEREASEQQLIEAIESKQTVEQELAEAQAKIENMAAIEEKLEAIEEMVKDDNYKYTEYTTKLAAIEDTMSQTIAARKNDAATMAEYTAHIKSLEQELTSVRQQMESLDAERPDIREDIEKLTRKIDQCMDYQNVYALESDFNQLGLTIQTTSNNRIILCKLRNGKAITENVVDDYIFVGSLDLATKELSERALLKIKDFVRANAGPPSQIENISRVWRNGLRMYESTIPIVNEHKALSLDTLIEASPDRE